VTSRTLAQAMLLGPRSALATRTAIYELRSRSIVLKHLSSFVSFQPEA
jgi:hypothetical protein